MTKKKIHNGDEDVTRQCIYDDDEDINASKTRPLNTTPTIGLETFRLFVYSTKQFHVTTTTTATISNHNDECSNDQN